MYFQVILHTALDLFRDDVNRDINHHGDVRTINVSNDDNFNNCNDASATFDILFEVDQKEQFRKYHPFHLIEILNSIIIKWKNNKIDSTDGYNDQKYTDEYFEKKLTLLGRNGIPAISLIFAAVYWIIGLMELNKNDSS